MLQVQDNFNGGIPRRRSAATLRPATPRQRRTSGPFIPVDGPRTTQRHSPSPPPPVPPSDYFSEIPHQQDYISAYQPPRSAVIEYTRSTNTTPLYDEQDYLEIDPGSCSFLSVLSDAFVQQLGNQETFTGEEAAHALHRVLAFAHYPEYQCIQVANALMHCKPNALFQPEEHYGNPPRNDVTFIAAWNQKYMLRRDALREETKPVGVLSTLTRCYAAFCEPGNQTCYAPLCPNRSKNALTEILPMGSTPSDVQLLLHDNVQIDADSSITVVPLQHGSGSSEELSYNEAARQRAIVELIRSHRSFCNILNILDEVIVSAILGAEEIGSASRRSNLISNAFSTYEELRQISQSLLNEMQDRRRQYQQGHIPQIADILKHHLLLMSDPLVQYLTNIPLAEYIIKRERSSNKEFDHVLERTKHDERIARSPITTIQYYYLAPRIQLPRYLSHLLGIRAHTPLLHPDYNLLQDCQDIIERIQRDSSKKSSNTQRRMEVLQLADSLLVPPNLDLKLTEPERRLWYQGKLRRSGRLRRETIHIFVFDHLVLLTKRSDKLLGAKYEIWDRPIPLPMLYLSDSETNCITQPPVAATQRRNGFASLLQNPSGRPALVFGHLGRPSQKIREFSCEPEEKRRCLAAIDAARAYDNHKNNVFHIDVFNRSTFRTFRSTRDHVYDRVHCSVPLGAEEGTILVSTDRGVYLMRRNEIDGTKLTLTRNRTVIKLAVMHNVRLLLALTDDYFLMAYTLESIMDSIRMSNGLDPPRCFCINVDVRLFQVGSTRRYKDLLIYKRHASGSRDEIVAASPMPELYNETSRQKFMLTSPPMFNGRRLQIARLFEQVHLRSFEAKGVRRIQFCGDDNVALVCMNNFRFLAFDTREPYEGRSSAAMPDKRGHDEDATEARAAFSLTSNRTLLCCNRYCFLIDGERNPIPSDGRRYLFKWESEPEQIVRHHNHVIGFSRHFIEFRSISSGELVQLFSAKSCRLIFEGTIDGEPVIHGCYVKARSSDRQQLFELKLRKT